MHKLVIVIEALEDEASFESGWPQFLHLAERMPGLLKETTSRTLNVLYGSYPYTMVHELYFDTLEATQRAMSSEEGRAAGKVLQSISRGRLALFFADHNEDNLDNIRKYTQETTGE